MHCKDLSILEKRIGYSFHNRTLLIHALTHTSYVNEHKKESYGSNQRLEFLGDAILDFVAAEYLYSKYPDLEEGDLSRMRASMVSEKPLASSARDIGLQEFLRLGKGEEQTGGRNRDSIISDAMEAVLGAVYLDGSFDDVKGVVLRCILLELTGDELFTDRKTPLQEIFQDRRKRVVYQVTNESGPDHDKRFTVAALVDGEIIGTGTAKTKKAAAQIAAEQAMDKL